MANGGKARFKKLARFLNVMSICFGKIKGINQKKKID